MSTLIYSEFKKRQPPILNERIARVIAHIFRKLWFDVREHCNFLFSAPSYWVGRSNAHDLPITRQINTVCSWIMR